MYKFLLDNVCCIIPFIKPKDMFIRKKVNSTFNSTVSKIYKLMTNNIIANQEFFLTVDTTTKLSYFTFKPRFQKLLKRFEISEHTIHDTRHTFATLLNNANANPTSITMLIGHSDFAITENIYTHKDTEELRKAVELIN